MADTGAGSEKVAAAVGAALPNTLLVVAGAGAEDGVEAKGVAVVTAPPSRLDRSPSSAALNSCSSFDVEPMLLALLGLVLAMVVAGTVLYQVLEVMYKC